MQHDPRERTVTEVEEQGIGETTMPGHVHDAVAEQFGEFFRASRWLAPVGNAAALALVALTLHDHIDRTRLISWVTVGVIVCTAQLAAFAVPQLARHTNRGLLPTATVASYVLGGLWWGSLAWLSGHADVRWVSLGMLFAVSAGFMSGISGMTTLTVWTMVPMWVVGSLGYAVHGQVILALGGVVFTLFLVGSNRSTSRLLSELIRLRVTSVAAATRAECEATHDTLTGLLNRAGLAAAAIAGCGSEPGSAIAALFIDLDHFKEVNDRFGHAVGDALLVDVAKRISAVVRPQDIVGRMGGDEFLVLVSGELSDEATGELTRRLINCLEEPFLIGPHEAYVSASIGVTRLRGAPIDLERLVEESDNALYHAKRSGRRQAVIYDDDLEQHLSERSGLEMALRKVLRDGAIEAWGQPVIDVSDGSVAWVELLARWETSPGSFVSPAIFVPLAEEIGVIGDLGRLMLDRANQTLHAWSGSHGLAAARISVNISALHLARSDLVDEISELMACHGLQAQRLIIELTESHRVNDLGDGRRTFDRLREMGVQLAIDDFGSGYSSLGQLLALPASIVKVDRSLVERVGRDPASIELLGAIHRLARAVGATVVAEGIETAGEYLAVRSVGIEQAQGYLLCPPLPLGALEDELLRRWPATLDLH